MCQYANNTDVTTLHFTSPVSIKQRKNFHLRCLHLIPLNGQFLFKFEYQKYSSNACLDIDGAKVVLLYLVNVFLNHFYNDLIVHITIVALR